MRIPVWRVSDEYRRTRRGEEATAALGAARSHLRQARRVVEELHDVVHSALAVAEDAEVDAAQARTADRAAFHLESAVEHLGRLRSRCDVICELSGELAGHLGLAAGAVATADELSTLPRHEPELAGAVSRINQRSAALQELIDLARPITDMVTGHADAALVASRETPTTRPLEPRVLDQSVRSTARELDRAEEDAVLLETVVGRAEVTSHQVSDLAIHANDAARRLRAHHQARVLAPPTQRGPTSPAP